MFILLFAERSKVCANAKFTLVAENCSSETTANSRVIATTLQERENTLNEQGYGQDPGNFLIRSNKAPSQKNLSSPEPK